jgi:transaldolase
MQHNEGPGGRDGRIREFVRRGFRPYFGEKPAASPTDPRLKRLAELGTESWLDSGDAEAIGSLWTDAFVAVTTNNTLLNKEVQKGTYDAFIKDAAALLNEFPELTADERMLELAFMLNARHGLTLVEQFDAYVSVEEHTALAHDLEGAVSYARRFHAICPERFIVKMPFTAAGVLATRRAAAEGIPVNHTLGFSARQNYLIARMTKPAFVNVFLGRLNSVAADNTLGSGDLVGERATLASQAVIRRLRKEQGLPIRQIAASLRNADQVLNLAGLNAFTKDQADMDEHVAEVLEKVNAQ